MTIARSVGEAAVNADNITPGLKPLNIAQARKKFEELTGRNITVIADTSFLLESKDGYPPLWAAREIVQNFGDHNTGKNKGTLNGIQYKTKLIELRKWKFGIHGNWPFNNPDTLMHLGAEGKGVEDTGGNGIGLKQVVVRSLRDWGVTKFEVQGNGWNVIYKKLIREEINAVLNKTGFTAGFNNDLIIAEMEPAEPRNYCRYIIETSDPELIDALGQIQNIGVSDNNTYLQNPDYKNNLITIKWLFPEEGADTIPEGRLFMGCQVARVKRDREQVHADKKEDYWGGLRGVTIAIKTPQKKSIDRPPLNKWDLRTDLEKPVSSMSKEDLIGQLKRSEPLWSFDKRDDEAECFILIKKFVDELVWNRDKNLKQEEFEEHFGGKKYLADEYKIQESKKEELREQGYIICPHYFSQIGMPEISSVLNDVARAADTKPVCRSYENEARAEESGLQITHEKLKADYGSETFFREIKTRLGKKLLTVKKTGDDLFEIHLGTKVQGKDLTHIDLSESPIERLKDLHFLRGVIYHGLLSKFFNEDKIALLQGERAATFLIAKDQDTKSCALYTRIVKDCKTKDQYLQVQVNEKYVKAFEKVFCEEIDKPDQSDTQSGAPPAGRKRSRLLTPLSISLTGLTTVGVLGLIFALRSDGINNGDIKTVDRPQTGHSTTNTGLPKEDQLPDGWDDRKPRETEAILDRFLKSKTPDSKRADGVIDENSKHLRDIAGDFNKADIKPAIEKLEQRIGAGTDDGHVIENFKIVQTPTRQEIAKINLLRKYIEITLSHGTGKKYFFENDIVVFTGDGTRGFNYRGLIGLHQQLFSPGVKFEEALSIAFHEQAHEALRPIHIKGHGREFISMLQSLNAAAIRGQASIAREVARKLREGKELSEEELLVINAARLWDELGK